MKIKLDSLRYEFDKDGNTQQITMGFSGRDDNTSNYLSANISILKEDLADKTFDDLSRNDVEEIGKTKLAELTKTK